MRARTATQTMASSSPSTMRSKTSLQVAAPILKRHGFSALVFVPTRRLGQTEGWQGANDPARPLMDWATVRSLAKDGIEFGGHSRTHADLTKLAASEREDEIAGCGDDLSAEIGKPVGELRGAVWPCLTRGRWRRSDGIIAWGSERGWHFPSGGENRFEVPRIDMHYFRNRGHWAGLLEGRRGYLRVRQALRAVRSKVVDRLY